MTASLAAEELYQDCLMKKEVMYTLRTVWIHGVMFIPVSCLSVIKELSRAH